MTTLNPLAVLQRIKNLFARAILLKSLSLALWADAYDAHKPTHGGK
jgi:hypothetical protein